MVSTQNTFFATNGFPAILGNTAQNKPDSVQRVLSASAVTSTVSSLAAEKIAAVVDQVNAASAAVLRGVSYNGTEPKSVAQLIAMGAARNEDAKTGNGFDETAAFRNDVTYFKVLLEAREKHRAAMQEKLKALHSLRTKQRKMFRKRKSTQRTAAIVLAALGRAGRNPTSSLVEKQISTEENWEGPPPTLCASPVSTDVESEVSSDLGDIDASDDKPVVYRA